MNRTAYTGCFLLFLCASFCLFAQPFPYRFETWNTSHGLSTNFCNRIAEDKNGYLFVASATGINRFNSSAFTPLQNTYGGKSTEGNVHDLFIDENNRLWFANVDKGLGLHDLRSVLPQPPVYFVPEKTPQAGNQLGNFVSKLAFDTKGGLWVGTLGYGLYRFDTAKKRFTSLPFENPSSTIYSRYIRSLVLYKPDTLFVGIINGLTIVNPLTHQIRHVPLKYSFPTTLKAPTVRQIIHWNRDTFAVATDRGAYFLHLPSGLLYKINREDCPLQLSSINCNDILKKSARELWLATERHGVIYFDTRQQIYQRSFESPNTDECIPKGFVSSFFKDNKENIWVCHQFGISVSRASADAIVSLSLNEAGGKLRSGVVITEGNRLVIIDSKGLIRFDPETKQADTVPVTFPANTRLPKMVMRHTRFGYVVFFRDRIVAVNPTTAKATPLPLKTEEHPKDLFVNFLIQECLVDTLDGNEVWWLMAPSSGTGLFQYDPATGRLSPVDFANKGRPYTVMESVLTDICRDGRNGLWISTAEDGFYYLPDRSRQRGIRCNFPTAVVPSIRMNYVSDLLLDGNNTVWATVYGKGLVKLGGFRNDTLAVKLYGENHNLDNPFLGRMMEDKSGRLWITSANDLYCFDRRKERFRKLTMRNGIRNARFDLFHIETAQTESGALFYLDADHLLYFHPQKVVDEISNPKLVLSELRVNEQNYNLVTAAAPLSFSVAQNSLSFIYDVLDYDGAGSYTLWAKLAGYENEWYKISSASQLTYRQLPGGNYTFRLRILLADGSNGGEQSLRFSIATAWYKTGWFYAAVCLLVSSLLYALYRFKLKQQLKIFHVRQRLHRDLHDDVGATLSSVKAYSEILGNNGNNEIIRGLIKENAAEMLDRLEVIAWATNPQHDNAKSLVNTMLKFARPLLHAHHVAFDFKQENVNDDMPVPGDVRQHVLLIFKEAINNLVKYAEATRCDVCLTTAHKQWVMKITDNGKGFDGSIRGGGAGIKNMRRRAEEMGGDLHIDAAPGGGTLVRLTVPHPFKIPTIRYGKGGQTT